MPVAAAGAACALARASRVREPADFLSNLLQHARSSALLERPLLGGLVVLFLPRGALGLRTHATTVRMRPCKESTARSYVGT